MYHIQVPENAYSTFYITLVHFNNYIPIYCFILVKRKKLEKGLYIKTFRGTKMTTTETRYDHYQTKQM